MSEAASRPPLGVYYQHHPVGRLELSAESTYSFLYDAAWLTHEERFPLSLALPLQPEAFGHRETLAFFENLLPEEGAADALERSHRMSSPFQFLQKFGKDCAGAVTVVTEPPVSSDGPQQTAQLDSEVLQKALDQQLSVAVAVSHTVPGYLSLAGAQDKFAAIYKGGAFYLPTDGSPTTHIVKPAIAHKSIKGSVYNELYVMKLAAAVGLNVPHCTIHSVGEHPLYVIERYDRGYDTQGRVYRVHQEDFCQARGLLPSSKYESAGGPSLLDHYELIKDHSHPRTRAHDLEVFLRWLAFNLFIGNNDCHAKNLSFLHRDGRTALAPFYDLLCTAIYPHLVRSFTYAIGGATEHNQMGKNRVAAFEQQLDVRPGVFRDVLAAMKAALAQHITDVATALCAQYPDATIIPRIAELIAKRSRAFRWLDR